MAEGFPGALTHHGIAPRHDPVGAAVCVNAIWEPGRHALTHQPPKCRSFSEGVGKRKRQWRRGAGTLGKERLEGGGGARGSLRARAALWGGARAGAGPHPTQLEQT